MTELGLWNRFMAENPIASPGTAAAWGHPALEDNDHITNPSGPGWHVDRTRFDRMLAIAAKAAGAEVIRRRPPELLSRHPSNNWHIEATTVDGTTIERRARAMIDATGRRAVAARARRPPNHSRPISRPLGADRPSPWHHHPRSPNADRSHRARLVVFRASSPTAATPRRS